MAFTRKEKEVIVEQYKEWVENSNAFFVMSYQKMNMAAIDEARSKLREVDGEIHVVKNRLFKRVMDDMKLDYDETFWEENNMVSFAFSEAPSVAKVMSELAKTNVFGIRLGYMDQNFLRLNKSKPWQTYRHCPLCVGCCWVRSWRLLLNWYELWLNLHALWLRWSKPSRKKDRLLNLLPENIRNDRNETSFNTN